MLNTIVAEAIGATPEVHSASFEFACKAGSEAMFVCLCQVESGRIKYGLAVGADTSQGAPGDALEYSAAAGAAAFLFGKEKVVAEVKSFKEGRDMEKVKTAIRKLYQDTKTGENVTRAMIDAVKVGVTMSEVVGSIRSGYGIHYDPFEQVEMPDFAREAIRE